MLTGNPPFASSSMTHLVADDLTMTLPRASRPDLPEAAERAIMKALAFRPEDRQASVRELGEQLSAALSDTEATRKTLEEPTRRTVGAPEGSLEMAHVLFTDLVGYSMLPMDRQKQYLGELQTIVRSAPRFRSAEKSGEIISLPTGDGMALVFFGDPIAAAQCALEVTAGLKSKPHLKLRMGIHTGPVYRVADINTNANVAGGGINIAQRVMDCGDTGHILVSKAVADVLLELSDWAPCLCDLGEHAVKHGVKVHIFNLATAEAGNAERPAKLKAVEAAPPKKSKKGLLAAVATVVVAAGTAAGWYATREKVEPLQLSYQTHNDADGIWFTISPAKPGYLYILNYGTEKDGTWTYRLLFPLNGGRAARPGGEALRVPDHGGFQPNTPNEKNFPYFVWATSPVKEMEALKMLRQEAGMAVVEGEKVREIQHFLDRRDPKVLVRAISLEKQ